MKGLNFCWNVLVIQLDYTSIFEEVNYDFITGSDPSEFEIKQNLERSKYFL